ESGKPSHASFLAPKPRIPQDQIPPGFTHGKTGLTRWVAGTADFPKSRERQGRRHVMLAARKLQGEVFAH
ncbi:MAG: hypothetical protein ACFCD0_08715, partial [Gemmataceae bacterium]